MVTGRAATLTLSTPDGDVRVETARDGPVVVVVLCMGVVLLKPPRLEGGRVLTPPLLPEPGGVVPLLGSVEVVRCFTLGSVEVRAWSGLKAGSVVFLRGDTVAVVIPGKMRFGGRVVGRVVVGLVEVKSMSLSWLLPGSAKEGFDQLSSC